jgi:hypothetical protein
VEVLMGGGVTVFGFGHSWMEYSFRGVSRYDLAYEPNKGDRGYVMLVLERQEN